MDFQTVIDIVLNQGVFAVLFVWLFYDSRKNAAEREDRLMELINEQGAKLSLMSENLATINQKIDFLSHTNK